MLGSPGVVTEGLIALLTSSPRIAFLDIDGTIVDHDESIADSTVEAIRSARARGHLVFISTGRSAPEVYPWIRDIGFDGEITAGGGFVEHAGELIIEQTMPERLVEEITELLEALGLDYYLQSHQGVEPHGRVVERLDEVLVAHGAAAPSQHAVARIFADDRMHGRGEVAKAVFIGDSQEDFGRVEAAVHGELRDAVDLITGTIAYLGSASGEISPRGVNKGTAILRALDHLGLDPAQAIGIGDSRNDVEMLRICGVGIAMSGAAPEVVAAADEMTSGVMDGGVWNAFRRHQLI
ncbi:Cof-type HAD-IIB family hydrolase [Aeromicrobium piscarium]|uniref:Cof-type HAD-IIB family hydrolase n=1 Tax=Aeromicrobium piscarium TaxID=2590901 RepID=A0A554S776_9ACTN|nr:Cof-type HAD-IIB family hydrolase [Aeromicrobium piscarium]TSD62204.1 Cof-type HAD-IIB family hydrolase [Aeromicrobium piscarium]